LTPKGRASIFEPINELSERVQTHVRASGFYDDLQPEWGEIRRFYDAHREEWYGTLVGWDERELITWFEAAGFSRSKCRTSSYPARRRKDRRRPTLPPAFAAAPTRTSRPMRKSREKFSAIALTTTLNGVRDSLSSAGDRGLLRLLYTSWARDELATGFRHARGAYLHVRPDRWLALARRGRST
jgi:hypothetical protein